LNNPSSLQRAERILIDPALVDADISGLLAAELDRVDRLFRDNLETPVGIVAEIGDFVAERPGKRVRPKVHLLCAHMCGYEGPHAPLLATVLEFIHSATLIHDDIIDGATTRRGRPSVNSEWGNNLTVLFGDYLLAKAMEMALKARSLEVMEKLADVTLRMSEGEMLQTRYEGRIDLTRDEYLDLIERKTAALFACCCELAGIVAGVDDARRAALRSFGNRLGMAFQLVDDLLDFTGDEYKLGKPAASDLREGKATLAVIDLLSTGDRRARRLVRRIVDQGQVDADRFSELRGLLQSSGALDRTRALAAEYVTGAGECLTGFPQGAHRAALEALPEMLLLRDR
jgi:octaprenyl-diphosphate synthase